MLSTQVDFKIKRRKGYQAENRDKKTEKIDLHKKVFMFVSISKVRELQPAAREKNFTKHVDCHVGFSENDPEGHDFSIFVNNKKLKYDANKFISPLFQSFISNLMYRNISKSKGKKVSTIIVDVAVNVLMCLTILGCAGLIRALF